VRGQTRSGAARRVLAWIRCGVPLFNQDLLQKFELIAPSSEYQSCRSHYLLQFLQRLVGVFSQWFLQERLANFECRPVLVNRSCWHLSKFFTNFLSKFEMSIYMKVVSLDKLENFRIGRF
jgi:hypothetical protein